MIFVMISILFWILCLLSVGTSSISIGANKNPPVVRQAVSSPLKARLIMASIIISARIVSLFHYAGACSCRLQATHNVYCTEMDV